MIRKMLCALVCALLLPLFPALAQEAELPPVFRLLDVQEDGSESLMGSAVLFGDSETLLTTVWALGHSGEIRVIGPDGTYSLTSAVTPLEESELALLTLDRPCEAAQPLQLFSSGTAADMALVLGITRDGQLYSAPQEKAPSARYGDKDAGLVAASSALAPGAVVLDEAGMLSGLVVAAWGEKPGHFAALTRNAIAQEFVAAGLVARAQDNWLDAISLQYEAGFLTVDWSQEASITQDSQMHVYLIDEQNHFYSWYLTDGVNGSIDLPVAPGRRYGVWVQHSQTDERDWDSAPMAPSGRIAIPEAQPLTAHHFRSLSCVLASHPADQTPEVSTVLPAMEEITAQTLADESLRLYLQATDSYEVAEEIEAPLLIALVAPDGQCFSLISGYIYMPELNTGDHWNAEVTELVRCVPQMCGDYLPGEYTLSYYIGGELAGTAAFTLE